MHLSDFDFNLPEELIAQTPLEKREDSRLMVVDRAAHSITHRRFVDILDYFAHQPLLVLNNTQVMPARLLGHYKGTEKRVELVLVEETTNATWRALVKGLARMKPGQVLEFSDEKNRLQAVFLGPHEGMGTFRLECSGSLHATLEALGLPPLPPYIKRPERNPATDLLDRERYQTVFAAVPGAIAAPTAGLHFSAELLERVQEMTDTAFLTLHVGTGTFQPIRVEEVESHVMTKEYYRIPAETWNRVVESKRDGRKVLAVGTTSTRVLESVNFGEMSGKAVSGWTDRFLYPGQAFLNVDQLLTNFHLPRSTLFLLVCAFAGKPLMDQAYTEAVAEGYRFFSYGDAMLIL